MNLVSVHALMASIEFSSDRLEIHGEFFLERHALAEKLLPDAPFLKKPLRKRGFFWNGASGLVNKGSGGFFFGTTL